MTAIPSAGAANSRAQRPLKIAWQERRAARTGLKEHILIVDDEKLIAQTGKEMLENLGYRVTAHTSSSEALETVRQQPQKFDLVITDFNMPQMNGVELARELIQVRPGIPIILFTAFSQAVSPENARELGIRDYLLKPLKATELHEAIRRVLDAGLPGIEAGPK